ncbi:hypothetical protein [Bosea sp. (in: a-proteobacteria)]|uniref:hypothetical protein n=1 Tax=Bosea sp. (in: a-proteobacteria) TaxID=1871050 RepID=UPI003F6EC5A9
MLHEVVADGHHDDKRPAEQDKTRERRLQDAPPQGRLASGGAVHLGSDFQHVTQPLLIMLFCSAKARTVLTAASFAAAARSREGACDTLRRHRPRPKTGPAAQPFPMKISGFSVVLDQPFKVMAKAGVV